ncbi:MAG: hypothetical protein QOK17_399 [Sphingomonadales bacterium]|jgi:hypothetical protein|nr:hypothetical protein [Sphingomonadales bacterium]
MMARARLFTALFVGGYLLILLVGLAVAWRLEPLSGDLARVGGYRENDFGWRSAQIGLRAPHAHEASPRESADIVVLGDSFSIHVNDSFLGPDGRVSYHRWTDFLGARTGLEIALFHHDSYSVDRIVRGPGFRRRAPRLFVYEVTERSLATRLDPVRAACPAADDSGVSTAPLSVAPRQVEPVPAHRMLRESLLRPQLGYAVDYLAHLPPFARGNNDARELRLIRGDLFSSRRPDRLLVFKEDDVKDRWNDRKWREFACKLRAIRREVERNGRTSFLLLIAPDKSTVYASFVKGPGPRPPERLAALMDSAGVPAVRLDQLVLDRIRRGEKDVYLPDDTHWDSKTHLAVAANVYASLLARKILSEQAGPGRPVAGTGR